MKYKIGDKVRIRKDLVSECRYNGLWVNDVMEEFFGTTATIVKILDKTYLVKENMWHWNDEMFENKPAKFSREIEFK